MFHRAAKVEKKRDKDKDKDKKKKKESEDSPSVVNSFQQFIYAFWYCRMRA